MNKDSMTVIIQAFLAVVITLGFFAVIGVLMFRGAIEVSVKDILLVLLGALLASFKEITGYFFGSSSGSAKKDEQSAAQNAALTAQLMPTTPLGTVPTGTPTDPVSVVETPPKG